MKPKQPKIKEPKQPKIKEPKQPKVKEPKQPKVKEPKQPKVKQTEADPRFVVDNREDIIKVLNLMINEKDFSKWAIDGEISLNDIPEEKRPIYEEADGILSDLWGSQLNRNQFNLTVGEYIDVLLEEDMKLKTILAKLKSKINK